MVHRRGRFACQIVIGLIEKQPSRKVALQHRLRAWFFPSATLAVRTDIFTTYSHHADCAPVQQSPCHLRRESGSDADYGWGRTLESFISWSAAVAACAQFP
jgi:hypothetical protein